MRAPGNETGPVLPANPVPSGGQEAANPVPSGGPEAANQAPPYVPYPYQNSEIIGGDSVSLIEWRLLKKIALPSAEQIYFAHLKAQDLFEVKVEIIRLMAFYDPTGDWMGRGAWALDNPRTSSGEESLERLYDILDDLKETGINSDEFFRLKMRVFRLE